MGFCINCGRELPPEAGFCPKCGTKVEVPCCPACGKEVDFDADFCLHCGTQLHEPESESAQPDPATEPEPQSKSVIVNETRKEAIPTPEPAPEKKVEIPDVCPRCGKATISGYDHCTYCGTYWEQAMPATEKPVEKTAAKTTEAPGQKTAADPEQRFFRDFSWSYKRATSRWTRQRAEIKVEVDDQRLRCTDTRNLRRPAIIEEEIQLKDISKITLAARASFWCWMAIALALTVMVAVPFLPSMGVPLVVSEGEMVLILALVGAFFAIELWWVRFNTYHHRLVIGASGESGQKEIVLEALKPDVLRELQTELTERTGIQPQEPEDTAATKVTFGVIIGVSLAIAIFVLVANQNPQPSQMSPLLGDGNVTAGPSYTPSRVTPAPSYPERSKVDYEDYLLDELDIFTEEDRQTYKDLLKTWDNQYSSIVALAVVNWGADYETKADKIWNNMDLRDSDALIFYDSSQDFFYLLHGGSFPVEADSVLTEYDFQSGQSRYISEILMNTLAGVGNLYRGGTPHSANDSPNLSRISGTYSYDQSFQNPDGTWTNFEYIISLDPVPGGLHYTYEWRGNTITDVVIPPEDITVEDGVYGLTFRDGEGRHTVTVFPSDPSSTDGGGQLYLDQIGPYEQW